MYKDAGYSIKTVVKTITGILMAFSVLIGLVILILLSQNNVGLGLLAAVVIIGGGCFLAWLSGLVLYAFGEIADRTVSIDEKLSGNVYSDGTQVAGNHEKTEIDWAKEPQWKCYSCGTSNPMKRAYCIKCGTSRDWSLQKSK